ncbi:hypothetical protein TVAG_225810 [Trichomonas vaginalis G3]|uniref:Leucine Rich Repeat family protein n=1 Tax=Trichomonas vaginalis (strain ATCC PRA-98 / G3) TaxID=412133 RepID=A2DNW0_TRIV3|nr:leucine-rich repeat, isoform f-related family [Trichomonas vaginalis G3]EAY17955.1 hypothetical protein TVAG_225810 [Trichomonas vaginalis G3]KAI5527137.1 leucine-rich repeat, isoform f-related family [Trichomonas vaginalis G3]|eukprot:XP_001578941.1 hypothetical protein [Trichomonas vaginalis G3]
MPYQLAVSDARDRGINPLYAGIVQEISLAENAVDLILIVSPNYLLFYDFGDSKLLYQFSWLELTNFNYSAYNIQLTFGNSKFNCFSEEVNQILLTISESLQKILKTHELNAIGFTPYKNLIYEPTPESIISRVELYCKQKDIQMTQDIQISLYDFLTFSNSSISIRQFQNQKNILPILCDILPLVKSIVSVELSKVQGLDLFHHASYISREKSNIQHISINGKATESFSSYLDQIMKNNDLNLQGLTFSNSLFADSQLDQLKEVVIAKEIRSLGFQRAISDENMKYFCKEFINSRVGDILVYLNLDFSSNIRLSLIFPNIPNIQYLSLEKCDLDIADVLNSITKYRLNNLKAINLSANNNIDTNSLDSIILPESLESISVDNIKWMDDGLLHFFQMIENNYNEKGVRLSIVNARCPNKDWEAFFSYLNQSNLKTICSLVWDRNPVNNILFDFLLLNEDLSYLSVNYCFRDNDPDLIQLFANFLINSPNLLHLCVRGKKYATIGSYISIIVDSVFNSNLIYLDLSFNGGGDDSIIYIQDLFDSNLQVLVADGLCPDSLPVFRDFLETAANSHVFLSFPSSDASFIISQESGDKESLMRDFYRILDENQQKSDNFYSVFIDERDSRFPQYIDATNISISMNETRFEPSKQLFELSYAKSAEVLNINTPPEHVEESLIKSPTKDFFEPYKNHKRKRLRTKTKIDWISPTKNKPDSPKLPLVPGVKRPKQNTHVSIMVNNDDFDDAEDYIQKPMSSKRRNRSVPANLVSRTMDNPMIDGYTNLSDGGDVSNIQSTLANAGDVSLNQNDVNEAPLFIQKSVSTELNVDLETNNQTTEIRTKSLRERKKIRKSSNVISKWDFPIPSLPETGEDIWSDLDEQFSFDAVFDCIKDDSPFEPPKKSHHKN